MSRDVRWEDRRNRSTEVARNLRQRETTAEDVLWRQLRRKQLSGRKFRRQHPVGGVILDFYCPEHLLAIEVDGSVHDDQIDWDTDRTRYLDEFGIQVIRFRNDDVLTNIDTVLQQILETVPQSRQR